jgi:hypothetical protein
MFNVILIMKTFWELIKRKVKEVLKLAPNIKTSYEFSLNHLLG